MRIDVFTIFPGIFAGPLRESLVGRAIAGGVLEVHVRDLRDYSSDPHRKVDDEPFGGGPGLVIMAEAVFDAPPGMTRDPANSAGCPCPTCCSLGTTPRSIAGARTRHARRPGATARTLTLRSGRRRRGTTAIPKTTATASIARDPIGSRRGC